MLIIRKKQMAVFVEVEIEKFVDGMLVHLRKFFPRQCEAMGEPQLRETIRYGIKRAAAYGITAERDVYKYVDLMVVFGRDFDADKQFPWAGETLRAKKDPARKMLSLHQAARNYLKRTPRFGLNLPPTPAPNPTNG
ncbi:MAG: hypothetical protein ABSG32_25285 [Terriglobia bacterium]|jgi:hypothetical protein